MQSIDPAAPSVDATWRRFTVKLQDAAATVADTLAATAALYPLQSHAPAAFLYQGELDPAAAQSAADARIEDERAQLQRLLGEVLASADGDDGDDGDMRRFTVTDEPGPDGEAELQLDGAAVDLPPEAQALLESLLQDLEALPEDYLQPAGAGDYRPADGDAGAAADAPNPNRDAILYDEWDFRRQRLPQGLVRAARVAAHPLYDDFASVDAGRIPPAGGRHPPPFRGAARPRQTLEGAIRRRRHRLGRAGHARADAAPGLR